MARRGTLLYLIAIVAPTLALLYLGLESVDRQRQAIATLSENNLRLTADRIAAELLRRTEALAALCLRDPALATIRLPRQDKERPEELRPLRARLQEVKARHSIADVLFVVEDGAIRYPRVSEPSPRQLDEYLAQEPAMPRARFAALFEEAERLELETSLADDALAAYRRSADVPVSDGLKAIALARVARNARKANQPDVARQAYRTLRDRYADLYDPFHRPFGLVAALELSELAGDGSSELDLARAETDLLRGRWELTAEQFDYFRVRIAERTGRTPHESSAYAHELEVAAALHDRFRAPATLRPGDIYPSTSPDAVRPYQTYLTRAAGAESELALGVVIDLNWIERNLVPEVTADLGVAPSRVAFSHAAASKSPAPNVARATVFPFSEVRLIPGDTGQPVARDKYAFVGFTLGVLGVLVLGVVLLMRDASRQLQLGRLRTDFVSGVSHELKTPLTLIRLYSETLSDAGGIRDDERKEYADIITRESDRLTQLIDNVLEFSRIDRGQKEYRLAQGDLAQVLSRTIAAYAQFLRRRGFAVDIDIPAASPPVSFDADAVAAAMVNLLDNAAKYAGANKFVAVRVRADNRQVVCEVEDHGIGIPAADQPRIFEQFYRAASGSEKGGHGLGLFLVKHIMDAHDGRVEFESVVGEGSRFRLVFPVQ